MELYLFKDLALKSCSIASVGWSPHRPPQSRGQRHYLQVAGRGGSEDNVGLEMLLGPFLSVSA